MEQERQLMLLSCVIKSLRFGASCFIENVRKIYKNWHKLYMSYCTKTNWKHTCWYKECLLLDVLRSTLMMLLEDVLGMLLLEFVVLNKRGELFINDFRKLWRYNEIQWWITKKEIKEAKEQNWLSWFPRKSTRCFCDSTGCFYQQWIKTT